MRIHVDAALFGAFLGTAVASVSEAAVTSAPYQQYILRTCSTGNTCLITFPAVPANFRIEVTNVSCYVAAESTPALTQIDFIQLLTLRADSSVAGAVTLAPRQIGFRHPVVTYAANETVSAFAAASQRFQIFAKSLNGQMATLACNLSGDRLKLS